MSLLRARHGGADAAAKFIDEHTKIDIDPIFDEECPICLDTYSLERCVQITGIPNCTHRIGFDCLMKMLSDRPTEEKRCPLCRTAWIPNSTPTLTRTEAANASDRDPRRRGRGLSTNERLFPTPSSDSSDDYEAQLRTFNAFTRDIQDIRARAGTSHQARPIAQPRRRFTQMRRAAPRPQTGNAPVADPASPETPDFSLAGSLPERRASLAANSPQSRDLRPASPEVVQLSAAEVQATQVRLRARRLEQREAAVREREKAVEEREAALLERERALVIAEQRVSSVRNLVTAQMNEAEELATRQREDLRRALG